MLKGAAGILPPAIRRLAQSGRPQPQAGPEPAASTRPVSVCVAVAIERLMIRQSGMGRGHAGWDKGRRLVRASVLPIRRWCCRHVQRSMTDAELPVLLRTGIADALGGEARQAAPPRNSRGPVGWPPGSTTGPEWPDPICSWFALSMQRRSPGSPRRCRSASSCFWLPGLVSLARLGRLGDHLVEAVEGVQSARVAHVGKQLCDDAEQGRLVVAHVEVALDVAAQLGLAATHRQEHCEGQQVPRRDIQAGPRVVVAEAVSGQVPLDVQLVIR